MKSFLVEFASTIAEITCLGRASVLVPSPYVPNDHQTKNASEMEKAGASVMLRERECDANIMWDTTVNLLRSKLRLREMEQNALKMGNVKAAELLAREMIQMIPVE